MDLVSSQRSYINGSKISTSELYTRTESYIISRNLVLISDCNLEKGNDTMEQAENCSEPNVNEICIIFIVIFSTRMQQAFHVDCRMLRA